MKQSSLFSTATISPPLAVIPASSSIPYPIPFIIFIPVDFTLF